MITLVDGEGKTTAAVVQLFMSSAVLQQCVEVPSVGCRFRLWTCKSSNGQVICMGPTNLGARSRSPSMPGTWCIFCFGLDRYSRPRPKKGRTIFWPYQPLIVSAQPRYYLPGSVLAAGCGLTLVAITTASNSIRTLVETRLPGCLALLRVAVTFFFSSFFFLVFFAFFLCSVRPAVRVSACCSRVVQLLAMQFRY